MLRSIRTRISRLTASPPEHLAVLLTLPFVVPTDYVVSYGANLAGTCIIKNGSFVLTVKIITVTN